MDQSNQNGNLQEAGRIPLQSLANTRDLGYLSPCANQRILPRKLIRSGALGSATQADLQVLAEDYQVKTIIDFRTEEEQLKSPDPKDELKDLRFVDAPILGFSATGITRENGISGMAKALSTIKEDPKQVMIDLYPDMLMDKVGIKGYKQFFEIVVDNNEGAVLWHCSAGKDRAGLASVLLLHVLGASWDAIVADYLATNLYLADRVDDLKKLIPSAFLTKKLLKGIHILNAADKDYLDSGINAVINEYGSLDSYLDKALGVDEMARYQLRSKYLY